ncbi:Acyl-CoA hydrolase [Desulfonauticus submarinus]|uniref:Acyl-CoA hydrolase n=1 Tax=Desulfonauticus submarinus TaxID=206665 RepID=A0A1H0CKY4_9BACT|nr:acyl-CoA thioesterase [Desulfonauticus submarinus]SDN58524.1 Acyl-CoA hydrolase [Desulfonauticus submarinus]
METYVIVRPEHLNHHGYLFGGMMLKWVDEFAWLAASKEFTGCRMVTIAMDEIQFKKPVVNGSILRFDIKLYKQHNTSATYQVNVYADAPGATEEILVFNTKVTFVRVNEQGKKIPLPKKNGD